MTVPYSVVIIKPLSVGRGDAPDILEDILKNCPIALRMFRTLTLCPMTLDALTHMDNPSIFPRGSINPSWICLFTHMNRLDDPTPYLELYFGSIIPSKVVPDTLRYKYGGYQKIGLTTHPSDDVVRLSHITRVQFEANVLFLHFDEAVV